MTLGSNGRGGSDTATAGVASPAPAVRPLTKVRLLILDDDLNDVELILREFRRRDLQIEHLQVDSAEATILALDEGVWDVALCDYRMGAFDAPQALELVQERGLDIPFIVVSGTVGEDVAVAMMRAGAHDYLMKGYLHRLVPAVEREIREAEVRRQRRDAERDLLESVEALRRTDDQRRRLLSQLITAQEEERALIADGIHDDSIQVMSAASMRVNTLLRGAEDPALRKGLQGVEETIGLAIDRLRNLLFELRPRALEEEGLASALTMGLDRIDGVQTSLDNLLSSEPPIDTRVVLYRVALEAITNARKHSRGTSIAVCLEERDAGYLVSVRDDGVGFVPSANGHSEPGHLGLTAMRERAEISGGWWRLSSEPGVGTTVEFWLPGD